MDLCAQFFNAGSDIRRADAQSIRLSCRVNISKNYRIRCGKCLSELIQECLGTVFEGIAERMAGSKHERKFITIYWVHLTIINDDTYINEDCYFFLAAIASNTPSTPQITMRGIIPKVLL